MDLAIFVIYCTFALQLIVCCISNLAVILLSLGSGSSGSEKLFFFKELKPCLPKRVQSKNLAFQYIQYHSILKCHRALFLVNLLSWSVLLVPLGEVLKGSSHIYCRNRWLKYGDSSHETKIELKYHLSAREKKGWHEWLHVSNICQNRLHKGYLLY